MVILQLEDQPLIIQAIFAGAVDEVEDLMVHPEYANCTDCEKRTPLHAAAFKGESQIASVLLEHGARVNAKDGKWVTPLHRACAVNSDETVDVLLKYQADVCARDRLWQTPLHIAAAHDAYNCVDKLLNMVPNPNVTDRSGRTALHHAAYNGNTFVAELLINRGCIVNACDKKDCRPLHCAVQMGHIDTVELLLRYGADINAKDRNQYTPLHVAAASGIETVTRLLLNSGAEVNAQNAYGNTPLHVACLNGHLACCQELALAGADIEAVNFRGQTPLHVAAASTHGVDCLAFLLAKGVDINKCSADGRTPLHMTAIHGRFTRSKTLIDKGALIDCADKNGSTPLHIAAQYGHDILANTLLSYGASPTKKGYEGRTPLHMCCLSGYVECCRKFLQTGVNLNERDDSGRTPTHCAAYKGSIECLDLLTSNGADFKLKDNFERLPLHYAAAQGHFQCVFTLVGIGSPINDRDIEGCTPLHLAAAYDHEAKCVEYLLNHRADPKIRDAKGFSALHYAIACGNVEGVKLLLKVTEEAVFKKEGGSPDVTPLHLAAKLGNVDVLRSVLTKYNDVNIQTDEGITPLILVAREGHIQCVHFLLRFGAKVSLCDNINQMTAVHYSAKNGHSQCLTILLHNSEDQNVVNMVDRQQRTALMLAVSGNHTECVQALLKCGADPNIVDTDDHSCLFRAVVNGQHNVVQLLLSYNAEVKTRDVNGKTVLHLAAACGHLTCLQLIMEYMNEEDILSKDNQDCTVLHWACYHGHAHCVEHLLSKNLFKELEGNSYSPVHCACFAGSDACLEHLLTHFGDGIVHLRDEKRRTALHIAALHGHGECAKLLLKHGADANVVDEEGRTPFITAAQYGQSSVVELLLSCNKDLSACDNDGNTALHWACLKKHHQTALYILENCHDAKFVDIPNNEKKTPLHLAARNGLVDVTRELLKKGANILAVDNEGLTPALSCAPSYSVAQCLALILQTLPDFLDKSSSSDGSDLTLNMLKFLMSLPQSCDVQKSTHTTQTQTSVVLVNDPDLFELKQAFLIPKESKKPKTAIRLDSSGDCFIKEVPKIGHQNTQPKAPSEKGKKLHKSEKELHLPITNILCPRPKKNYNLSCKDCQRFQEFCLNCQKRNELKQKKKQKSAKKMLVNVDCQIGDSVMRSSHSSRKHAEKESSYYELGKFLTKVLSDASTSVREKCFKDAESVQSPKEQTEALAGGSDDKKRDFLSHELDFFNVFEKEICQEIETNLRRAQSSDAISLRRINKIKKSREKYLNFIVSKDVNQHLRIVNSQESSPSPATSKTLDKKESKCYQNVVLALPGNELFDQKSDTIVLFKRKKRHKHSDRNQAVETFSQASQTDSDTKIEEMAHLVSSNAPDEDLNLDKNKFHLATFEEVAAATDIVVECNELTSNNAEETDTVCDASRNLTEDDAIEVDDRLPKDDDQGMYADGLNENENCDIMENCSEEEYEEVVRTVPDLKLTDSDIQTKVASDNNNCMDNTLIHNENEIINCLEAIPSSPEGENTNDNIAPTALQDQKEINTVNEAVSNVSASEKKSDGIEGDKLTSLSSEDEDNCDALLVVKKKSKKPDISCAIS